MLSLGKVRRRWGFSRGSFLGIQWQQQKDRTMLGLSFTHCSAFQLSPACLMFPALMWSSTLVQWCMALLPCNPSSTQQAAWLTVAFSSQHHLIRENQRKCDEKWGDLSRLPAIWELIDLGRMSCLSGYLISFGQHHWLTDGKDGSETGLGSDHLAISSQGTASTLGLKQRRAEEDQWLAQAHRL